MVREGGLEPPRACAHWILNPARLPIPPLPQGHGGRGGIRTHDLWLRRPTLYPTELRALSPKILNAGDHLSTRFLFQTHLLVFLFDMGDKPPVF